MQFNTLLLTLLAAATASAASLPFHARAANASAVVNIGSCNAAMSFELGRPGRKATEGTFLNVDPKVAPGQEDALNPNIITNAICNGLINNCGVKKGDAGETACLAAKAKVAGLSTKDQSTADAFNAALAA